METPTPTPENVTEGQFSGTQPEATQLPKATDNDIIKTQADSLGLTIVQMVEKREELDKEIFRLGVIRKALSDFAAMPVDEAVEPDSE